jgi:hypothetical protein
VLSYDASTTLGMRHILDQLQICYSKSLGEYLNCDGWCVMWCEWKSALWRWLFVELCVIINNSEAHSFLWCFSYIRIFSRKVQVPKYITRIKKMNIKNALFTNQSKFYTDMNMCIYLKTTTLILFPTPPTSSFLANSWMLYSNLNVCA